MVDLKKFRESFYTEPFKTVDNIHPSLFGREFNPFVKFRLNRKIAFMLAVGGLVAWILFGFDSCIGQPMMVISKLPEFFAGRITIDGLVQIWNNHYGKEMHYSAFVIYGLAYWYLSRYYEKHLGIVKSKNVAFTCSFVLLSIGLFEFYWMGSYSYFQNQAWVTTFRFPQAKIILQNMAFVLLGGLGLVYVWADSYGPLKKNGKRDRLFTFNFNKTAALLGIACVGFALLWWYYPFHVDHITVGLESGEVWTNTRNFPNTLYTIDMNPLDNVNAGEWFFVENNAVHALNTFVKVLWTLFFVYVGKLNKVTNI